MQPRHYEAIQALNKCTFIPGSFEKRFVHDMKTLGEFDLLSIRQEMWVEKLAYRYRRQIGRVLFEKRLEQKP